MSSSDFDYESILDDPDPTRLGQAPDTRNASSHVSQRRTPSLSSTDYSDSPRTSKVIVALPRVGGTFTAPAQPPSFAPPPLNVSAAFASRRSTRSNTLSSVDRNSQNVVKRKPLSSTSTVLAAHYSATSSPRVPTLALDTSRDSRSARPGSYLSETSRYSAASAGLNEGRSSVQNPAFSSAYLPHDHRGAAAAPATASYGGLGLVREDPTDDLPPPPPPADRSPRTASESTYHDDGDDDDSLYDSIYDNINTTNADSYAAADRQASSPTLNPELYDGAIQTATTVKAIAVTQAGQRTAKPVALDTLHPKPPLSPALSKLGNLFAWGSPSQSNSEFSPFPSPISTRATTTATDGTALSPSRNTLTAPARPRTNDTRTNGNAVAYCEAALPTPPPSHIPSSSVEIEEMEDELKAISVELAASIRREMDLEDLVERIQAEGNSNNNAQAPGKRTSDYYSDSGISSAKFSEFDQTREEIEKVQRRGEQEKAQLRLELTTKLQDEREKRRDLDGQIRELSDKAAQMDAAQMNGLDTSGRLQTLEETCADLRRKLSEEREVTNNFEDLLSVLKGELQTTTNERDNLRDEIVPQLRARVEGLESQAADQTNLAYETTKIQQDLLSLKEENESLRKSREAAESRSIRADARVEGLESQAADQTNLAFETTKMQQDLLSLKQENESLRKSREEAESRSIRASIALSRSNSVTAKPFQLQQAPASLTRSNTTRNPESKDALAERLKDVEAQRDALHSALKNLLDRQEHQTRENTKKIRFLEMEREQLLEDSPKKGGYERDVANLRSEVSVLRRRAEDAMEQKWRVEEGLIHLKMDLDRAEEEIAMLRSLLGEKDILIPPTDTSRSSDMSSQGALGLVTSESLERAYREIRASYSDALERIKELESNGTIAPDEKTQLAMSRLELALSSAVSDRDAALDEASAIKSRLESLMAGEGHQQLATENALADDLSKSAVRVEELASQVKAQLEANSKLRQRLTDAVARGDADRESNTERVTRLQDRLRALEEQLVAAQTTSEERVARHEAEIAAIREAHNSQLNRLGGSSPRALGAAAAPRSPRLGAPSSRMLSPLPSPLFPRSPRLLPQKTVDDDAEVSRLRDRVAELERAVAESDREMQDVVAKMSEAQIEVMTLQEERDVAVREARKVQAALEAERVRGFEEKFRSLSGVVG